MQYEDEEAFDLAVVPKRAYFSAESGGASRHLMVNGSSERIAIKVKCSNNHLFRIAPVFTVLEPGCAQRLQIVRDPGAPAKDKLVLLYKQTSSRNPREVFAQCNKLELKRLLIVLVTKCHHHQPHSKTTNLEDIDNDESQESILRRNEEMECDCERRGRENDLRANSPGKASSSAGTATALTDPHDIIALIDDIEEGDEEGQWGGRSLKEHQQQAVRAAVAAAERKY